LHAPCAPRPLTAQASAGPALKPALHALHAYRARGALPPRPELSEALRTLLLYRRQAAELQRTAAAQPPSSAVQPAEQSDAGDTQRAAAEGSLASQGEVRGAAGSMAAALKLARAPKAAPAKSNWLAQLSEHRGRQKIKRAAAQAVGGVAAAPANYGVGVTMSQTSGKMHFPVLYRFNEGYTNAVKRSLCMADVSKRPKAVGSG